MSKATTPALTAVDISSLVGKKISKPVPFMDAAVNITKLTVDEIKEVTALQDQAISDADEAKAEGDEDYEGDPLLVLRYVVRTAVEGAKELPDAAFGGWPIQELSALTKQIMTYSGVGDEEAGN
jgi:hypothetical protein